MNKRTLVSSSWILLVLAVVLWAGTGYFAWVVLGMQADHARYVGNVQAQSNQETQSAQVRSLARETAADREVLEQSANVDLLSAVNAIESIGDTIGVKVHVSDAQTEKTITGKAGTLPVNAVNLSIDAEGGFASMMRVFEMIETLPFSATVEQMSLSRGQQADTGKNIPWNLMIKLHVLTTATISS